jgi:hypothetical protein
MNAHGKRLLAAALRTHRDELLRRARKDARTDHDRAAHRHMHDAALCDQYARQIDQELEQ